MQIGGVGMVTGIGHSTAETRTSVDSGIRRFRETRIRGLDGRPIKASLVLPISPEVEGLRRAERVARPALAECVAEAGVSPRSRVALLLCTRRPRPPLPGVLRVLIREPDGCADALVAELVGQLAQIGLEVADAACVAHGHAGGIVALDRAAELLSFGDLDACIVGGVHTPGERGTLEALDALGLVQSSRVPHAPIPGEAAAFLCLRNAGAARGDRRASVDGWGITSETGEAPNMGAELTAAMASALGGSGAQAKSITSLFADLNGDRGRAKRVALATMRTLWSEGATPELLHPCDRVGDVDAAIAPLLLGLAAHRVLADDRSQSAMVVCSTPDVVHGAAVVRGIERGHRS